jgi:hypothetical protein
MTELTKDLAVAQTIALITSYSFDLQGYAIGELLPLWLDNYHASWVRLATIEALYLGRYKVVSIEQILQVWSRLGSPNTHFTHEFERLICRKLPRHLVNQSELSEENLLQINEKISDPQLNISTSSKPALPKQETLSPDNRESLSFTMSEQGTGTNPQESELPSPAENSHQIQEPVSYTTLAFSEDRAIAAEKDQFELGDCSEPRFQPERQGRSFADRADDFHGTAYHTPIHRFTPLPDVSPLFYKLKAVAQQKLEEE